MADLDWLGQAACDEFFKLHDNEVFRGIGAGAVLLPPHSVPASRSPSSGCAVIEAFPHGLAYGSMMTVLVGYLAFGAIAIMSPLLALLIPTLFTSFDAFSAVFGGIMLLATTFMLRF
ncbi:hypothetical protein, partial [Xanthomonas sacchari]